MTPDETYQFWKLVGLLTPLKQRWRKGESPVVLQNEAKRVSANALRALSKTMDQAEIDRLVVRAWNMADPD